MYSYKELKSWNQLLQKFLWLCFRLRVVFMIFFKFFFVFKCTSVYYDYSLGLYPKIFNDRGFFMKLDEFLSYLHMLFFCYFFEFLFIFFFILLFWYTYKQHAIFFQLTNQHHYYNQEPEDENLENISKVQLDLHLNFLKTKNDFIDLKTKKKLIDEKKRFYKLKFKSLS